MPAKVSAEEIQRYVERMHTKMAAESDQHAVSQAVNANYSGWNDVRGRQGIWDFNFMQVMFLDCLRSALPDEIVFEESDNNHLGVWVQLIEASSAFVFYEKLCYVCPYPEKCVFDEDDRWHNGDGPAAEFRGGGKIYYWHGTHIDDPALITCRKWLINPLTIDLELNVERRRIMIEMYGLERWTRLGKKIHQDEYGTLYRKTTITGAEPIVAVAVKNSTPEPGGSYKTYFLRVPQTTKTAKEAVAWTFGLPADEYGPTEQT